MPCIKSVYMGIVATFSILLLNKIDPAVSCSFGKSNPAADAPDGRAIPLGHSHHADGQELHAMQSSELRGT